MIAKSLGKHFEPNAVPTIFKNGPPPKKLKRQKHISRRWPHTIKTRTEAASSLFIFYRFIGLIENEKLLGYVKERIKAFVNQFKL